MEQQLVQSVSISAPNIEPILWGCTETLIRYFLNCCCFFGAKAHIFQLLGFGNPRCIISLLKY
jgi:hypothetical protein